MTIVFFHNRAPDDPHQQLIKRMIAVEGDTVVVAGSKGSKKLQDLSQVSCLVTEVPTASSSSCASSFVHAWYHGILSHGNTCLLQPPSAAAVFDGTFGVAPAAIAGAAPSRLPCHGTGMLHVHVLEYVWERQHMELEREH